MTDRIREIRDLYAIDDEIAIVQIDTRFFEIHDSIRSRLCAIASNLAQQLALPSIQMFVDLVGQRKEEFYLVDGTNICIMVMDIGDHTDYILLEPGTWRLCKGWVQ